MATFVNHYSFPLLFGIVGLVVAVLLLRDGIQRNDLLALAALLAGFILAFSLFSAGSGTDDELQTIQAEIGAGQPVLLEIQSPYCLGCAAAKPIVDSIARQHPNLRLIRVDILQPVGRALADRYQTRVTPTFLFFDGDGQILLRTYGAVDPQAIDRLVEG
ncbi:MAG: thioredoxin family protein [Anaerolineales bacterium]